MPETHSLHFETLPSSTRGLLEDLSGLPLIKQFYLAGGTALAIYFGHRESADLDFFTDQKINLDALLRDISSGGAFELEKKAPDTLLGMLNGVKVSFFHYPYPLLEPVREAGRVRIASVIDVACMKIDAIASRGTKRDFIDVYCVLQSKAIGLGELLSLFQKKYTALNYNIMHIKKSLTYFEDAEEEPVPKMLVPLEWDEIKKTFREEVAKL